jgi:hypothetical protein
LACCAETGLFQQLLDKLVNQHILPQPQSPGTSDRRKTTQHARTNRFFRILPPVTNRVTDPAM